MRQFSLLQRRLQECSDAEIDARKRRVRRLRRLQRVEIPANQLFITEEIIGKGGFGTVYIADYNGRNAAAKVMHVDVGTNDDCDLREKTEQNPILETEKAQRRRFMHELEAMKRLCSPHTVQVFGAVTTLKDQFILVMELLPGGDLRSLLKRSTRPLADGLVRQIVGDICGGVAFLHSKSTIHGDLKSANVLFDGEGRAKVSVRKVLC